jgi:hypothetical protein
MLRAVETNTGLWPTAGVLLSLISLIVIAENKQKSLHALSLPPWDLILAGAFIVTGCIITCFIIRISPSIPTQLMSKDILSISN